MAAETILVTGGTGTVGRALVTELVTHPDVRVRILTRNPAASIREGVEVLVGDLDDEDSVRRAADGCARMFLLTSGTRIAQHDATASRAAARSGVAHVVKLSALGAGRSGQDPITGWHRAGEDAVRRSAIGWTMLRPTGFMSNALDWAYSIAASGSVAAPFPTARTAVIDPADVARVAAAALTEVGHQGRIHELTGPQPLQPPEQVQILADVLDQRITYLPEDADTTTRRMQQYGMPPELAAAVVALLASATEPWNGAPLSTVEQVTGKPPTTFRTWAQQHRDAFAGA